MCVRQWEWPEQNSMGGSHASMSQRLQVTPDQMNFINSWVSAQSLVLSLMELLSGGRGGGASGLWTPVLVLLAACLCCVLTSVSLGLDVLICSLTTAAVALLLMIVKNWKSEDLLLPQGAVLITGCDSGFGHALALQLSDLGVKVFAGVLDLKGDGAERLRGQRSEKLQVLQLDVTDRDQVEAARSHICDQVGRTGLWALVNNAGIFPCPADGELLPLSEFRRCMDVNFLSAVHMCQMFLPLLRRSRGRVVNVSSLAADLHMPLVAAYSASKAALSIFSRVLRMELSTWDVKVVLVQPTGFRTKLFSTSDNDIGRLKAELLASVSSEAKEDYGTAYISSLPYCLRTMSEEITQDLSPVVDALCHALLSINPRRLYTPGQMGFLLPFLYHHCPAAIFDYIIDFVIRYR